MARNYAVLPHEYGREMKALSDAEFGRLCRSLIDYSETGTPIALCGNERFFAERVMMQEDRFKESYESIADRSRKNGAKGGRPKGNPEEPRQTQTNPEEPRQTQKTQTKTETDTPNGVIKRAKAFAPPTPEEVARYCAERGNGVDPHRFVDFYAAKGWMVGKNRMKDWKAAVRTWERQSKAEKPLTTDRPFVTEEDLAAQNGLVREVGEDGLLHWVMRE